MTMDSYLQFRRPNKECLLCGTTLEVTGKHPTILRLGDKDEAIRQDFCPACWQRMEERDYFSFWVTKRILEGPTSTQRRLAKSERNEALWALFAALYARRSPELDPQLFLIAHLLMKYRVIAYQGVDEAGMLRFFHAGTQETYMIADLPLDAVSFVDAKEAIESSLHEFAPRKPEEGGESPADID